MQQIEAWFEQQYNSEVQLAYQRQGSKLRNTIRTKTGVRAYKTHFKKAGKGQVGDKGRGGNVPVFNSDLTDVECTLADKWGGAYVGELDELKHSADERAVVSNMAAYAHGRYTDELLFGALKSGSQYVGDFSAGLSQSLVQQAIELLNKKDVPDDGDRYAAVTPHAWEELLKIDAFAKADYIGSDSLPWLQGSEAKRWRGILWMPHSGTPLTGVQATNLIWHKTCAGHAIGQDLKTTWSWENTKGEWFCNTRMSQGAVLIDGTGVVQIRTKNDTTL